MVFLFVFSFASFVVFFLCCSGSVFALFPGSMRLVERFVSRSFAGFLVLFLLFWLIGRPRKHNSNLCSHSSFFFSRSHSLFVCMVNLRFYMTSRLDKGVLLQKNALPYTLIVDNKTSKEVDHFEVHFHRHIEIKTKHHLTHDDQIISTFKVLLHLLSEKQGLFSSVSCLKTFFFLLMKEKDERWC